jgi:hypothetical protein
MSGFVADYEIGENAKMERNEYLEKLAMMRVQHKSEMQNLQREFALAQSPFKVADFVSDHLGTIKIDYIDYDTSDMGRKVRCLYVGPCYTKKGKPFASGERRTVFQTNVRQAD